MLLSGQFHCPPFFFSFSPLFFFFRTFESIWKCLLFYNLIEPKTLFCKQKSAAATKLKIFCTDSSHFSDRTFFWLQPTRRNLKCVKFHLTFIYQTKRWISVLPGFFFIFSYVIWFLFVSFTFFPLIVSLSIFFLLFCLQRSCDSRSNFYFVLFYEHLSSFLSLTLLFFRSSV